MKTIAVAGSAGFVGAQIMKAIHDLQAYQAIPVTRQDSPEQCFAAADVVVHAANPARRFQAENDPVHDFDETMEKTARFIAAAGGKPFILISSISCRTQLNTSYGRNRRACELLALGAGALVIRLGPMYGGNRTRDTLHDILEGRPVFVSEKTLYAYADVAWVSRRVVEMIGQPTGIREIGARNAISLASLRDRFCSQSVFSGPIDTQIPDHCPDGPDAELVFAYAERERTRGCSL